MLLSTDLSMCNVESKTSLYNHVCTSLSELDMEMIAAIPPGGNWKDIPLDIAMKSNRVMRIRKTGGRTTYYGRLNPQLPSYTINTYFNRPGNGTFIHPIYNRLISIREAARLQSFPDEYCFLGSTSSMFKQVGNAVPPILARVIGERIPSGSTVDLFAGAGGLSEGLTQAKHRILLAADYNSHMCATYKHNHPETEVIETDLNKEDAFTQLIEGIDNCLTGKTLNLLAGGPPCQGYSTAGHWKSDDPRNSLVNAIVESVRILQPEWVLIENVPGLKWMKAGAVLESVIQKIEEYGYSVWFNLLHAEEYCVPQRRKRLVLVGNRSGDSFRPPQKITSGISFSRANNNFKVHDKTLPFPVSVNEAISDLQHLAPSFSSHETSYQPAWTESNYQLLMRGAISFETFVRSRA
jgi:DNA (cytosine-5)-methyltransferase 1